MNQDSSQPNRPNRFPLGVVLCGGASTRMGRDKATLMTDDGKTFLEHAIERLAKRCERVGVSAKEGRQVDCELIPDPPRSFGPMTGILASLEFAEHQRIPACLFTPVDTPFLQTSHLDELIDAFEHSPDRIVCAVSDGNRVGFEPLIGIYPVDCLPDLRAASQRSEFGLQRFLTFQSPATVTLPAAVCRNLNAPSDLTD